jgi:hypothetical protein
MNCPNCGDANAIALFTSIQCINHHCNNFNRDLATETLIRDYNFDALALQMQDHDFKSAPLLIDWDLPKRWKQTGTYSGRFSSSQPNYSNLPKKAYTGPVFPIQPIRPSIDLFDHQIAILDYIKMFNAFNVSPLLPRIV